MVVTTAVSPEFEKVGRALAGGNVKSICRAVFANPHLQEEAIGQVSMTSVPLFAARVYKHCRRMTLEQAESFLWTQTISELETKAPTLFCFVVTRSAGRNKHKKGKAQYPGLCTAVAILLKEGAVIRIQCSLFI